MLQGEYKELSFFLEFVTYCVSKNSHYCKTYFNINLFLVVMSSTNIYIFNSNSRNHSSWALSGFEQHITRRDTWTYFCRRFCNKYFCSISGYSNYCFYCFILNIFIVNVTKISLDVYFFLNFRALITHFLVIQMGMTQRA